MKISELAKIVDISVDTLRYYEKIGLLTEVERSASGYRKYAAHNVEQLRIIRSAQHSGFSLQEIAQLLAFRKAPIEAKRKTQFLAQEKLDNISRHIEDLTELRDELKILVKQCGTEERHCPIIEKFEDNIQK